MSREEKKLVIALLIGIGASVLFAPTLATKLQWPVWLTYIVVALDGIFIAAVPYQFKEFLAEVHLIKMGFGGLTGGPGESLLIFIIFGLAPVLVFFWLAWQFLS